MTAKIHRLLMTIGAIAVGLGSVWNLAEVQPLGIPPEAGAVSSLIAAIAILVANSIRANYDAD